MDIVFVVVLLFASFQPSECIKCTPLPIGRCKCSLSDGASGIVDLSPLFSNGPITTVDPVNKYKYTFDPCLGVGCAAPCSGGACAICQVRVDDSSRQEGLGSLDADTYTITSYDADTGNFSLSVVYSQGDGDRKCVVDFIYNATATTPGLEFLEEDPVRTYQFQLFTNGPGALIANVTTPINPGNSSGPYPIQKDACTGWSGDKSVLASSGLLKLTAQALNLNYTWTKDEYTFDYYVGVCVVPLSTPLSGCYVIQKTTNPNGVSSFTCVGKDLDVQVTDTKDKGWMLLSYATVDLNALHCESSIRRTKIFFFCSRGAGSGTPLFMVQNPLQDDCFYQFSWPTDILCGPVNNTQPSPAVYQSPISLESAVLIGIGGATLLILAILLVTLTICTCYLCARKSPSSAVVSKYRRMNEPVQIQEGRD